MGPRTQRALLVALTVGALVLRLQRLLGTPHPTGTDGYYYVVQVESLLREGRLHVPDASWVHGLLAGVGAVVADPVLAVKLGACLLAAACVPAAWRLGRALGAGDNGAWLLAGWAAASPTLTHLAGDFPKNLGLAAPWLLLLALLAAAVGKGRARWVLRGLSLLVLALGVATAHRTGAALLLLAGAGAGLGWLGRRLARPTEVAAGRAIWLGVGVLLAAAVIFALGSVLLPAWLHPADLARLQGRFALEPHWPAPWGWLSLRPTEIEQIVELSAPWLVLVAVAPAWFALPGRRPWLAGLGLPLLVLLFPGWRLDELDLGYRLGLLTPLVAVPLAVVMLAPWLGARPGVPSWVPLLALGMLPAAHEGFDPGIGPPYERYGEVIDLLPRPLPSLLIAHQGMSFYYDHLTGQEAMAWAPEAGLDRREVARVVWGVQAGEWRAFTPDGLDAPGPVPLGHGYHCVREDLWEAFLARAEAEGDDDLRARLADWRNPQQVRPAHMLRGR